MGLLGGDESFRPDNAGVLFHPSRRRFFVYLANESITLDAASRLIFRVKERYAKWAGATDHSRMSLSFR